MGDRPAVSHRKASTPMSVKGRTRQSMMTFGATGPPAAVAGLLSAWKVSFANWITSSAESKSSLWMHASSSCGISSSSVN